MASQQAGSSDVSFIPASEVPSETEEAATEIIVREPWEKTLHELSAKPGKTLRVPRNPDVNRKQVVNAFQDAFALMGGTPRLALWADENPGAFYALYSKLMPKQVEQETKMEGGVKIVHVLPRGRLDE